MAKDVSNRCIVILIILLLIVSVVGFYIVSDKIDKIKLYPMPLGEYETMEQEDTGTISLRIEEGNDSTVDEATGMVSLTILKK